MEAMFVNNDALFINNSGRLATSERRSEAKRRRTQEKFPAFFFASFFENSKPDFPAKHLIINHLNHFSPKVQKNLKRYGYVKIRGDRQPKTAFFRQDHKSSGMDDQRTAQFIIRNRRSGAIGTIASARHKTTSRYHE
jgi:hypothetical protein